MSWALVSRLWQLQAVRGLALAVGVLVAISAHGHLRYADGKAAGIAAQRASDSAATVIAQAAAARERAAMDSLVASLRGRLAASDRDLQIAKQAAALATGRYGAALEAYEALKAAKRAAGDTTTTPIERACETTASTCALSLRAKETEVAAAETKLAVAEQLAAARDSTIRAEPARVNRAVADAIRQDRATQHGPSRTRWFLAGAVLAKALQLVLH